MRNFDNFSVDQVQNLMNKNLITEDEITEYILRWNANSHFCTLKRWEQNLSLMLLADAKVK